MVTLVPAVFQNASQNSLELVDDPKAAAVDEIAAKLGLTKVGLLLLALFSTALFLHFRQRLSFVPFI